MKSAWGSAAIAGNSPSICCTTSRRRGSTRNADVIDGLIEAVAATSWGVTSVVVSHDVRGSFRVADRVALCGSEDRVWPARTRSSRQDPAVLQFLNGTRDD